MLMRCAPFRSRVIYHEKLKEAKQEEKRAAKRARTKSRQEWVAAQERKGRMDMRIEDLVHQEGCNLAQAKEVAQREEKEREQQAAARAEKEEVPKRRRREFVTSLRRRTKSGCTR